MKGKFMKFLKPFAKTRQCISVVDIKVYFAKLKSDEKASRAEIRRGLDSIINNRQK